MFKFALPLFLVAVNVQFVLLQNAPQFLLFTRDNPQNAENLGLNNENDIRSSHFDGARNTKLIVHGYLDDSTRGRWMHTMKDRFLNSSDLNVILVDWSRGNVVPYPVAAVRARGLGQMVASQIQDLSNIKNSTPSQFHILGHSLGGQVAAFAGKALDGNLGQITGLDPAGPGFQGRSSQSRLSPTDAQFVDVIHTDSSRLGTWETWGTVDIYVNGGQSQPGCLQERYTSFSIRGRVCNHMRAAEYYSEAITKQGNNVPTAYKCATYATFRAGQCTACGENQDQCVPFGPKAVEYARNKSAEGGRFYITTNASSPFFS